MANQDRWNEDRERDWQGYGGRQGRDDESGRDWRERRDYGERDYSASGSRGREDYRERYQSQGRDYDERGQSGRSWGEGGSRSSPQYGGTGMVPRTQTGNYGTSGRYYEDYGDRADYGGYGGYSSGPGARSFGSGRGDYPNQGGGSSGGRGRGGDDYRYNESRGSSGYDTERGYPRYGQGYGGSNREWEREPWRRYGEYGEDYGAYGDYSRRSGGYGAGGGYTPNPREGMRGGEERSWGDKATDEVRSWFGDQDAARRRQWDEQRAGGQHRGRGPKGYQRSDDRIREDVNDRLTDDPYVDASEVSVQVSSGEVTLTGTVESRQAKRRAEDCAESVSGVTHVQNNLRVQESQRTGATGASGASGTGSTVGSQTDQRVAASSEGKTEPGRTSSH